jgi:hypothetical protein
MAQFGASIQTAQITTGNFQTTVDPSVSGYAGYPNNPGQRNPLGAAYYDSTGSNSNPWGTPGKYRYVQYKSTSNPALTNLTAPAPCYWVDNTFTSVTPVSSESTTAGINSVAGLIMPNTTALTTLTAALLNSNFIWICVGGFVSGVVGIAGIAAGDSIIGSATTFAPGHVAANSAATNRVIGYALSAEGTPAAGEFNILVTLES